MTIAGANIYFDMCEIEGSKCTIIVRIFENLVASNFAIPVFCAIGDYFADTQFDFPSKIENTTKTEVRSHLPRCFSMLQRS